MSYNYLDLRGERFGKLTVREMAYRKNTKIYWLCDCDCGNEHIVQTQLLRSGKCTSCGCSRKERKITVNEPKLNNSNIIDLSGKIYGKLKVISFDHVEKRYGAYWLCECECGNSIIVRSNDLRTGNTKSCGCDKINSRFGRRSIDITGKTFNRLTAIRIVGTNNKHQNLWECKCVCGNTVIATASHLINNVVKSCGCLHSRDHVIKLVSRNPLYRRYMSMLSRCYNPNDNSYKRCGARGIYVCEEWYTPGEIHIGFTNYYNWCMNNGYKRELSIDRIDNDGPYAPWNCRFADNKIQANNKRSNHIVNMYDESYTLTEFCEKYNINIRRTSDRLHNKWNTNAIIYDALHPDINLHRDRNGNYRTEDGFLVLIPNYGNDT